MDSKADLADGKIPSNQLPEINSTADKITITDTADNFVSGNVEGALSELFQYANNGKTAIQIALSNKGVTVSLEDTFTLLASKITAQMCKFGGTATSTDVLIGKTFINNSGEILTGTMFNVGVVTQTLTTQGGQYTITAGYHDGRGKVTANISNLVASNIKKDINVGGVVGEYVTPAVEPVSAMPRVYSFSGYNCRGWQTSDSQAYQISLLQLVDYAVRAETGPYNFMLQRSTSNIGPYTKIKATLSIGGVSTPGAKIYLGITTTSVTELGTAKVDYSTFLYHSVSQKPPDYGELFTLELDISNQSGTYYITIVGMDMNRAMVAKLDVKEVIMY